MFCQALCCRIRVHFVDSGVQVKDEPFTPHLTVAKIKQGKKGIKKIPSELWSNYRNTTLGYQKFGGIDLVEMMRKEADGYYRRLESLDFSDCAVGV